MNNILILDFTADTNGWEFASAQEQARKLEDLGVNVTLEQFGELCQSLVEDIIHPDRSSNSQELFVKKCEYINSIVDQIDYINIRCHGGHKNGFGYADLFCSKERQLNDFAMVANFEVLLQMIPKLKTKDVFFTICHGGYTIQSFSFDGLKANNQNYIFSLEKIKDSFSLNFLTQYVERQVGNSETPKESFDFLFNLVKNEVLSIDKQSRINFLKSRGLNNSNLWQDNLWESYINSVLVDYIYMGNSSEIINISTE